MPSSALVWKARRKIGITEFRNWKPLGSASREIIPDVNCENGDPPSGGEVLLRAAKRVGTFGGVVTSSLNP
jgi:hypothetical protein